MSIPDLEVEPTPGEPTTATSSAWSSTPPTEPGLYWLHSPRREETWGVSSFIVEAQRVELDGRSWLVLRGTALGAPDHRRQCFNYDLLPGHLTLPGDLWAPATPPPLPM